MTKDLEIKFIIKASQLRNPPLAIKMIADYIELLCGDCYIEFPVDYIDDKDLDDFADDYIKEIFRE